MEQKVLNKILEEHQLWLESEGIKGKQADLQYEKLSGFEFIGVNLRRANLYRADLKGNDFSFANLRGADLRNVNLQNSNLHGADLYKAKITESNLKEANLHLTSLRQSNLSKANLANADIDWADLNRANLQEAELLNANLQKANLQKANFFRANLQGANLKMSILEGANLTEANLFETNLESAKLDEANLCRAKIENANFDNATLVSIKIDKINFSKLPKKIVEDYGKSFFILGFTDLKEIITRSVEFPPEYQQAGMSILNYFGTILKKKYPDQQAKVRIEQDGKKVTMIIDPSKGDKEFIEHALDEYGLVMTGQMAPEEYTDDRLLVLELKNELRIAKARVESQKEIIEYQRADMKNLQQLIDTAIRIQAPIQIKNIASSSLQSDIKLNFEITLQISLIQGSLNELKEQLSTSSEEAKSVEELQQSLNQIEHSQSKEEVSKSTAMSKFKKFLENVEKAETTAGKVIKTTKDGIDIARKLAGHYNQIAQWCGLPQVPEPIIKK